MSIRPILSSLLRNKTGALLIAAQVALSLAILANALYIVSERLTVAARPSGITDESTVFHIKVHTMEKRTHEQIMAARIRDETILRALPGVRSVAWVNQMPMTNSGQTTSVALTRQQAQASADVGFYYSPGPFLQTLGLKLVEGRDLHDADVIEVNPAADMKLQGITPVIITQALARHLYPAAGTVVGKPLFQGDAELNIVGVVEHLQTPHADVGANGEYSLLMPVRVSDSGSLYALRTEAGQLDQVMRDAAAALQKADRGYLLGHNKTVAQDRVSRYQNDRALAWMLIAVCVLLLLVTASGIIGMASFWINQRRKQIGVRRALGARQADILRLFLTENLLITTSGIVAGVVLSIALNQLLVSQLELSKLPLAYPLFGAFALWALGLLAVYGPATRAARISPAIATRSA